MLEQLVATVKKNNVCNKDLKVDKRMGKYIERYERLRNIVGFHDEHLWRRYAIRRIIKRQLMLSARERPDAQNLIDEMVLARYIPEEEVSAEAASQVDKVIEKYLAVQDAFKLESNVSARSVRDWFFGIMAVEIEDVLGLLDHERIFVESMHQEMLKRLEFPKHYVSQEQIEMFVLIAVSRTLVKADQEFIAYWMIKKQYPGWFANQKEIELIIPDIWRLKAHIAQYEKHPLFKQIERLCKKHSVIFHVLDDVVKKYQGNLFDLRAKAHNIVRQIYFNLQSKVKKQVWHSFIYLLITKFILVLLIEMPYDKLRTGDIHYFQPAVTIGVPLFLLVALTIGVRVGSQANTELIIKEVESLMAGQETELETKIKLPEQRSLARSILFNILFLIAYGVSYGSIIYFLLRFDFNPASGFLFLLFITLATYMAVRIRFTAERFRILRSPRGVSREVLYFFALPVLATGSWIAQRFSNYNLIIAIFDLLFEAPYKTLILVFRDFSDFAREKREEIG